jgi:hypothetical protein
MYQYGNSIVTFEFLNYQYLLLCKVTLYFTDHQTMNPTLHNLSHFSEDELVALLQCITLQAPASTYMSRHNPAFNRVQAAHAVKTNIVEFCGKKINVDMRNLSRVDSYWYDLATSEGAFGRAIDTVLFTKWAMESIVSTHSKTNQRRWYKHKQHKSKPRVIVDELGDFDFEYPSNRSRIHDLDDDPCPMLCGHDGSIIWDDGAEV